MDRTFVIFDFSEVDKVDFSQVLETSADTLRKSVDGTKTFVKWESAVPTFLDELETKSELYSYEEIIAILQTPEWTAPMEMPEN
jgi:hypothetical protein